MEGVKQKAEEMKGKNGEDSSNLAKDIYHIKWIVFKGEMQYKSLVTDSWLLLFILVYHNV